MALPDELEAEARRLEIEVARLQARIAGLRELASKQRQLDAALAALDGGGPVLTSSTSVRTSPNVPGAMVKSNAAPPPSSPTARGFRIAAAKVTRFRDAALWKGLEAKSMSISAYARMRQAMRGDGKPSVAAVASWMDTDEANGRPIPEDEARFAAQFFGEKLVPPDTTSWPHGIRVNRA